MQGDPRIIDLLNQVLRKELTGINQYFIHSRMCKNWGYAVLTKVHFDESVDEMKHADKIIERILFLEGVPNLSDYDPILVGQDVKQQIDLDLALEMAALALLRPGVRLCLEAGRPCHTRVARAHRRGRGAARGLARGPDPQDARSRLRDLPRPANLRAELTRGLSRWAGSAMREGDRVMPVGMRPDAVLSAVVRCPFTAESAKLRA